MEANPLNTSCHHNNFNHTAIQQVMSHLPYVALLFLTFNSHAFREPPPKPKPEVFLGGFAMGKSTLVELDQFPRLNTNTAGLQINVSPISIIRISLGVGASINDLKYNQSAGNITYKVTAPATTSWDTNGDTAGTGSVTIDGKDLLSTTTYTTQTVNSDCDGKILAITPSGGNTNNNLQLKVTSSDKHLTIKHATYAHCGIDLAVINNQYGTASLGVHYAYDETTTEEGSCATENIYLHRGIEATASALFKTSGGLAIEASIGYPIQGTVKKENTEHDIQWSMSTKLSAMYNINHQKL